jgi:hypothetical protein
LSSDPLPSTTFFGFADNLLVLVSTTMTSVVSSNLSDWIDTPDSVCLGSLVSSKARCGVPELQKQNHFRRFLDWTFPIERFVRLSSVLLLIIYKLIDTCKT